MAATRVQHAEKSEVVNANTTVTWPGATTAGNLLIAWSNGNSVYSLPSGFTTIYASLANNDWKIGYKVAAGTETSHVFALTSGPGGVSAGLIEYSGASTSVVPFGGLTGIGTTNGYNYGYSATGATITPAVQVTYSENVLLLGIAAITSVFTVVPTLPVWTAATPLAGNNFTSTGTGVLEPAGGSNYAFLADNMSTAADTPTISCAWTGDTAGTRALMVLAFKLVGPFTPVIAAGTGAANSPGMTVSVPMARGTGTGTANQATTNQTVVDNAPAALGAGTGTARTAGPSVSVMAGWTKTVVTPFNLKDGTPFMLKSGEQFLLKAP